MALTTDLSPFGGFSGSRLGLRHLTPALLHFPLVSQP